mgnify:FL=1
MLENIGKIIEVNKSNILIETNYKDNLLNHYLKINNNIIVEVINRKDNILITKLLGEITNNSFSYGVLVLPNLDSTVSIPNEVDLKVILANVNYFEDKDLILGKNPVYNKEVTININSFFQNHFAIFGSTGSGKSCGVARIIQNLYSKSKKVAYNSNLFIFDTFGEYTPVLKNISNLNPYLSFKHYTTDPSEINNNILSIPPWLLGIDELAILLNATNPSQLLILEKALKYVNIFKRDDDNSNKYKNDVLARCIIDILLSGKPSIQIRDQVFSILSFFKTNDLSLETIIPSPGYNRALKHCLLIDKDGKMQEMQLLIDFFSKYLIDKVELTLPTNLKYDLNDLEDALEFALIDEGVFKSEKVYDELNILKVRLHSLNNSSDSMFFKYDQFVTRENYIIDLIKNSNNNNKCQIIHFNISYVNDRLAKTIVKIISKMLFDYSKFKSSRTSVPFHIILEEAHRYVQNDNDVNLLGYKIFERIAKEGRKYGVLLGLISQRPDEISTTVVSQCNNFLIFKMNHPKDLEYIKQLVPNITDDEINDLRILKPGSCIGFGTSFKFPSIVKIDLPSPTPLSNNVNISKEWFITIN